MRVPERLVLIMALVDGCIQRCFFCLAASISSFNFAIYQWKSSLTMKTFLCSLLGFLTITLAAEGQLPKGSDIDLKGVFTQDYTCIGIPAKDSVYICILNSADSLPGWSCVERIAIPEGTIAIDGNISKVSFLSKTGLIFEELGRYDTLTFNNELPPIRPRLWIRGPHSTEADSYFLSGEKNVCYYRQFDEGSNRFKWHKSDQLNPYMFTENHTRPLLTDMEDFEKLYTFNAPGGEYLAAVFKDHISFHRYATLQDSLLKHDIIDGGKIGFQLPGDAITAFVYNYKYIGVVTPGQIRFYQLDRESSKWVVDEQIPVLKFAELYPRYPENI